MESDKRKTDAEEMEFIGINFEKILDKVNHVSSAASNLGGIVTSSRTKVKLMKNIEIKLY